VNLNPFMSHFRRQPLAQDCARRCSPQSIVKSAKRTHFGKLVHTPRTPATSRDHSSYPIVNAQSVSRHNVPAKTNPNWRTGTHTKETLNAHGPQQFPTCECAKRTKPHRGREAYQCRQCLPKTNPLAALGPQHGSHSEAAKRTKPHRGSKTNPFRRSGPQPGDTSNSHGPQQFPNCECAKRTKPHCGQPT
jgi:hypothetical protein